MRILGLALLLAGCAPLAQPDPSGQALARELAGRTAGEPESCLPAAMHRGLRVIDRRTLAYDAGRTLWINRLPADCPGIEPPSTLIVEVHAGRYCRGDLVRGLEGGSSIPGPTCILGEFVPYRRPR